MNTRTTPVTLGLVPISKFVFSHEDALRYKAMTEARLRELGIDFVNIDGITDDGMLYRNADLPKVIDYLREKKVDALFCPHCNFGTEDVAAQLGKEMRLPYLLWGPRDEMPLPDGTRLRDSACGVFATSYILSLLKVPFTYIPNCRLDHPIFERNLRAFLQVAATVKSMRRMKIGQIGQRVDFFWTVMVNEAELLQQFGIELWQIYPQDVMARMRAIMAAPTAELRETMRVMRAAADCTALDEEQMKAVGALKLVMSELADSENLSAIALQCFPDIEKEFRIYPCYANSWVTLEGTPVICETDIHGAIASAMLQSATQHQGQPFFADLTIRHPEQENAILLWHCGAFCHQLAENAATRKVGEHFIMPGDFAGVCHWRLRGGDVTVARFTKGENGYCLGFGEGRATNGPATVGTYLWLEVPDWSAWERKIIRGPYIHHVAGIHGQLSPVLYESCRYISGLAPDPIGQTTEVLENYWWDAKAVSVQG